MSKIPNPKLQIPNKFEFLKSKIQNVFFSLFHNNYSERQRATQSYPTYRVIPKSSGTPNALSSVSESLNLVPAKAGNQPIFVDRVIPATAGIQNALSHKRSYNQARSAYWHSGGVMGRNSIDLTSAFFIKNADKFIFGQRGVLNFKNWNLEFVWDLGFNIWDFKNLCH